MKTKKIAVQNMEDSTPGLQPWTAWALFQLIVKAAAIPMNVTTQRILYEESAQKSGIFHLNKNGTTYLHITHLP